MKQESNDKLMSLRERNKERTRMEIMKSAFALFKENGFDNVSVEMICEAAGISRATFFNYFPQKELIFADLANARLQFMREFLAKQSKEERSSTFQDIIDLMLALTAENERDEDMVKFFFPQVLQRPLAIGASMASREEFLNTLIDLLKQMKSQGEPINPKHNISNIAELLIAIYFSTVLEWIIRKDIPKGWLSDRMRTRLQLAADGILIAGEEK